MLRDPLVFHEQLGELAIRLLRNLCARSPANQFRAAECAAHQLIIDCIGKRFEFCDAEGAGCDALAVKRVEHQTDENHHRMRLPFFGFAVEFLVNFVTCNETNAELVWSLAFPDVLEKLLTCDNHAAASAAAALVHNCIAVVPSRMTDIVKIWSARQGPSKSLAQSLLHQLKTETTSDSKDERFSWSFMIIRRLIGASLLQSCLNTLGPSIEQILALSSESFSEDQDVLLKILDASASKSAEVGPEEDDFGIEFPDDNLPFLGDMLEAAFLKRDGNRLKPLGSIVGSAVLIGDDSSQLDDLRIRAVKVAIHVLQALASQGHNCASGNQGTEDDITFSEEGMSIGLKGVMMRLIAVCCDLCKSAQDSVRNLQGLPFILNALSYEKDVSVNPFLREWAILAVRNLTLGNPDNAKEISSFELRGVQSDNEFLEKTGLEAFVDDETGKPRLRMRPQTAC